jgi:RHS repeat-associated protein
MDRLEEASHFDYLVTAWVGNNRGFQEKIHGYDLNGNILKLSRREFGGMLMDSLRYDYTGNKLNYVRHYGNQGEGFINTNTGSDDYHYDYNGNLDKDRNKGILNNADIKYNYLNLPTEIKKGAESIRYIYDATGKKLAQEVYSNNGGTLVKYTDYIGELVYEGNVLQFIQHPEGRVLPDGAGWEYQYHLKDHLGNVRVTFTTKPQTPVNYSANLETGTANSGQGVFGNYTSTAYDLVDHTDAGTTYQRVQWLNGGASGRVGLAKSLSVMPGDRVSVTAYAKYMNLGDGENMTAFAAALTAAFGVSSASTGEQLKLYNSLNGYGIGVAGGNHPGDDDTAPKAFVTILLLDRNYNLLDAGWEQMTTDLEQVSSSVKEPFDYPLTTEVTVQEPGFAYIFVSNEHPTYVDVYFDDVSVSHTPSPIVSSSDYFPFGLTFNSYQRENSVDQKYKFNGIEKVTDLDLNTYMAFFRMGDPAIGRWWQMDPKVDEYYHVTPYNMMGNNPVNITDPLGDEWVDPKKDGKVARQIVKALDKQNASLVKQNAKLQGQIDKANSKGDIKKADALEQKQLRNTVHVMLNNNTKDKLAKMGDPTEKTKFTFQAATGIKGGTQATGGAVVMSVLPSLGNRAHEVEHGYNIGIRKKWDGEEKGEQRAYKAQIAADPTGIPPSTFTATPTNSSEVTSQYVGGIMEEDGKTPVYPTTYKKYKKE